MLYTANHLNLWLTTHESVVNDLPPLVMRNVEILRSYCLSLENTSEHMDKHFLFYHIKGIQSGGYFAGMIYGYSGVLFLTRILDRKKSFPLCCGTGQYEPKNKKITISDAKNLINMCYNSARIEAKGIP